MDLFTKRRPEGFATPTSLPADDSMSGEWQKANRHWWESHPMRYDWGAANPYPEGSREFFREIDARFFAALQDFLPCRSTPFDPIVDYADLAGKDVLEIGVGAGSAAQLLATRARSFTGIDLTDQAVRLTGQRMTVNGLRASIQRMDAEAMTFPDGSFDFIWSWGVIHHSANTRRILEEMHRVLRPGGRAIVMIYHRSFWNYYVGAGLCEGILRGGFLRDRSLNAQMQNRWDGALARFYTRAEWARQVEGLFQVSRSLVCGQRSEVFPLNLDRPRRAFLALVPVAASRFWTNRCAQGSFLVTELQRL